MNIFLYLWSKLKRCFGLFTYDIKFFSLLVLLFVFVSACNSAIPKGAELSLSKVTPTSCKIVQYALEEACTPLNPSRIVVLYYHNMLPTILALGVKPIGAMTPLKSDYNTNFDNIDFENPFLSGMTAGIKDIGYYSSPSNLEAILALHPDLILGWDFDKQSSELLSYIAPTVLFSYQESRSNWKQFLKSIAATLNRTEVANQLIDNYELRVTKIRQIIESHHKETRVAVLHAFYGSFYIAADDDVHNNSIFDDIGLQKSSFEGKSNYGYIPISEEMIPEINADIIFFLASGKKDTDFAEKLQKKPLWRLLKAVQKNQVYQVHGITWSSFSILARNAILDDIYQYLIDNL